MKKLEGKTAVITGGTRGIGLAIATAYAREGASVVISSRSKESVEGATAVLKEGGYSVRGIAVDVGELSQVRKILGACLEEFGKLDIWFNNAATSAPYGPTWLVDDRSFDQVVQTNILGVYYGSITAMRYFVPRGQGKLINMLGAGAKRAARFQNAYGSSKAWTRSFTKTLAMESKNSGVGVFAYSPGMVLTEMLTDVEAIEGYEDRFKAFPTILKMWANPPEKVTEEAIWLASDATDSKTGIEIYKLTMFEMLRKSLIAGVRKLAGKDGDEIKLNVRSIPPSM